METQVRQHPKLYTAEEAVAYLHLDCTATLDTFRRDGWLRGHKAGKRYLYWQDDLDDCALRIVGITPPARVQQKEMRLAE